MENSGIKICEYRNVSVAASPRCEREQEREHYGIQGRNTGCLVDMRQSLEGAHCFHFLLP